MIRVPLEFFVTQSWCHFNKNKIKPQNGKNYPAVWMGHSQGNAKVPHSNAGNNNIIWYSTRHKGSYIHYKKLHAPFIYKSAVDASHNNELMIITQATKAK